VVNDRENNIVIFSCFINLHFLCNADVILMNGTFQYACQHFCQFFTSHGFKNGYYVPVVFALCLLPNKTVHTYSKLFEHINLECSKFVLTFNPIKIVVDFENGIHLAIQHSFPQIQIKGCFFHLKQTWYKKILKLGLSYIIQ
jgi:hypothetical protein